MKQQVKYIFIVLVYKNHNDLIELIENIKKNNFNHQIVVVNSYYDDRSLKKINEIANKYKCDFINIENKGYGYGNNRGIEFAINKFEFEYLIVSNPDIIIEKFDEDAIDKLNNKIIGPMIKTSKGKSQNPYWFIKNDIGERLIYEGYKRKNKWILYLGIAMNKIIRELFLAIFNLFKFRAKKVFALHGSFVIFPQKIITDIGLPYDEDMFLFAEEAHLAHLLEANKIESYISRDVQVVHKEDGSINISNINEKNELRKSIMIYYEKILKKKVDV